MGINRSTAVLLCFLLLAVASAETAFGEPANRLTLTYELTDCTSPPTSFEAVKQPGQGAALHLVDGSGKFVAMTAVVLGDQTVNGTFYEDGTVLYETLGFSGRNGLPTVTCTNTSPVSGITARVTGYVTRTG